METSNNRLDAIDLALSDKLHSRSLSHQDLDITVLRSHCRIKQTLPIRHPRATRYHSPWRDIADHRIHLHVLSDH
jgi:hypothetical protein